MIETSWWIMLLKAGSLGDYATLGKIRPGGTVWGFSPTLIWVILICEASGEIQKPPECLSG